ncbi:hypothetical protein D3C73_1373790 [compost metagenome]
MYVSVLFQHVLHRFMRERIKLFDAHNGNIFLTILAALLQQVVINLTRTHYNALHAFRIQFINLANGWQERTVSQFVQRGHRQRMTQQ